MPCRSLGRDPDRDCDQMCFRSRYISTILEQVCGSGRRQDIPVSEDDRSSGAYPTKISFELCLRSRQNQNRGFRRLSVIVARRENNNSYNLNSYGIRHPISGDDRSGQGYEDKTSPERSFKCLESPNRGFRRFSVIISGKEPTNNRLQHSHESRHHRDAGLIRLESVTSTQRYPSGLSNEFGAASNHHRTRVAQRSAKSNYDACSGAGAQPF